MIKKINTLYNLQNWVPGGLNEGAYSSILEVEEAVLTAEYSGMWELQGTMPIGENVNDFQKIVDREDILCVDCPQCSYYSVGWRTTATEQLFWVYRTVRTDNKKVKFYAIPAIYQWLKTRFLKDVRPTNLDFFNALKYLNDNAYNYSTASTITFPPLGWVGTATPIKTAYYVNQNMLKAINGSEENSMINRWGGIIMFDNFTVIRMTEADESNRENVWSFEYGKDLTAYSLDIDISEVITWVRPIGYNGRAFTSVSAPQVANNGIFLSSQTNPLRRNMAAYTSVTFSDIALASDIPSGSDTTGKIICSTISDFNWTLYYSTLEIADRLRMPKITIDIEFVNLADLDENKNTPFVEALKTAQICLGDKVKVVLPNVDNQNFLAYDTWVQKMTWDCAENKILGVELGNSRYDFFATVNANVNHNRVKQGNYTVG